MPLTMQILSGFHRCHLSSICKRLNFRGRGPLHPIVLSRPIFPRDHGFSYCFPASSFLIFFKKNLPTLSFQPVSAFIPAMTILIFGPFVPDFKEVRR